MVVVPRCLPQQLWTEYRVEKISTAPMKHFSRKFGWVLLFAVLLLFLFPLSSGSFTQTHGPTTEFRAHTSVQVMLATMALTVSIALSLISLHQISEVESPVQADSTAITSLQLRC